MRKTLIGCSLLALVACGGPGGGGDEDVVGTWVRDSNYGESTRSLRITFSGDGSMTAEEIFEVDASAVATNGGCSSEIEWDGSWSTSGTTLTVTAESGVNTTTGCNDASLNATGRAA